MCVTLQFQHEFHENAQKLDHPIIGNYHKKGVFVIYVGIDISKLTFDVAGLNKDKTTSHQFNNNPKGFKAFFKTISNFDDLICCMEATGVYGLALAKALFNSGYKIIVANPIKTHAFTKMEMLRGRQPQISPKPASKSSKTDCHQQPPGSPEEGS